MTHPSWPTPDEVQELAQRLPDLIRFGGSSWNYPGWSGLIYQKKYPRTGASTPMLAEYARWPLFRTVGVDSFFYAPPTPRTLEGYAAALPPGFPCIGKVWDRITAHTFANPRERSRHGELNPDWLNAEMYLNEVLGPQREHFADHLGPQVFEIQTIARSAGITTADFAMRLDKFFSALPTDSQYAVEIRNEEFLAPEYFAVLREHGVGHVFNSWTRMPSIGEQITLHESVTAPFIVMRALLRPGRKYGEAVDSFGPYEHVQEENPVLRAEIAALARLALQLRLPAYLLINNRAEGNAPTTIAAVARLITATPAD